MKEANASPVGLASPKARGRSRSAVSQCGESACVSGGAGGAGAGVEVGGVRV